MAKDPLKQFKIGERQRPGVVAGRRGAPVPATADPAPPAPAEDDEGLRFDRLEEVLDHEDPRDLGSRLAKMLTDLEAFAASHTSARDRAAARHARQAVERTIDLLDHLFKVREALAADSLAQVQAQADAPTPARAPRPQGAEKGLR